MRSAEATIRFREIATLGKGGMGTTYLACAKSGGSVERLVVLKRLHPHLAGDDTAKQRLLHEAELAGYVHHANVVPVHMVGEDDRGVYVVLDYVEGATLSQLRKGFSPPRLPVPIALRIAADCLAGLSALHTARDHQRRSLQILHRDVSPQNILIGLDGCARLTDFGIAKAQTSVALTGPTQLIGKIGYMAPEYADKGFIGPSMDIYAMGITLWTALVGTSPWNGLEDAQILARALTEGVPPPPESAALPADVVDFVMKACARDCRARHQTAAKALDAIEHLRATVRVAEHWEVAALAQEHFQHTVEDFRARAASSLAIRSEPPPPLTLGAGEDTRGPAADMPSPPREVITLTTPEVLAQGAPRQMFKRSVDEPDTVEETKTRVHAAPGRGLVRRIWVGGALTVVAATVGLSLGAVPQGGPRQPEAIHRAEPVAVSRASLHGASVANPVQEGSSLASPGEPSPAAVPPPVALPDRRGRPGREHGSSLVKLASPGDPPTVDGASPRSDEEPSARRPTRLPQGESTSERLQAHADTLGDLVTTNPYRVHESD